MTEVRSAPSGAVGVFATRAFQIGDVVLEEENPLVVLAPASPEQEEALMSCLSIPINTKKKKSKKRGNELSSWKSSIVPPSTVSDSYTGKFQGMVQAAACYALQMNKSNEMREALTALYHPNHKSTGNLSAEEQDIVHVAQEAVRYLQKRSKPGSALEKLVSEQPDFVTQLMLVWSCNAFEGGRIYEKASRVNHSCDPNAIVVVPDKESGGRQLIRAAAPIAVGEEIVISYLGLFLYADGRVRQQELQLTKHFACQCQRCRSPDIAAAIPCPSCHARHGRHLDEDVQYDDDQTVCYSIPPTGLACGSTTVCNHCHETTTLPSGGGNAGHVLKLSNTVSGKIVSRLRDRQAATKSSNDQDTEAEFDEQLLQLASTVVGARHWTTNLMLLLHLDRMLQAQHSSMLLGGAPVMSEVAEGIDALERLCRFVQGLDLKLHMGHVLSHVVVGVSRTLVSLGDVKSKKYASEWLGRIQEYTEQFESDGMKKVVETLQTAWEKGNVPMEDAQEEDDGRGDKKRAKMS